MIPHPCPTPRVPDVPFGVSDLAGLPAEAACAALRARRGEILDAVEAHGAVRIGRTDVRSAEGLEAALGAIGLDPVPYTEGQSPRDRVRGHIYTSTRYPASERVPMHHELSYRAAPPDLLVLLCVCPPRSGGQTPLLDGQAFLGRMPAALRVCFEARGVCYRKTMHGGFGFGRSWQQHFEIDDRDAVERFLVEEGADWTWLPDGALRVTQTRPAISTHPRTGARVWHNQATLWHPTHLGDRGAKLRHLLGDRVPTDVCWEDGSAIDDALIAAVRAAEYAHATRFDWEAGDLLLVDNHRVAHGREPFLGDRLVLVAMGGWPT